LLAAVETPQRLPLPDQDPGQNRGKGRSGLPGCSTKYDDQHPGDADDHNDADDQNRSDVSGKASDPRVFKGLISVAIIFYVNPTLNGG
jgi:hypothetical protein